MIRKSGFWLVALVLALLALPLAGSSRALAVAPTNDDFSGATVIGSLPYTDSISVRDAVVMDSTDPVNNCSGDDTRSIWYSFTPASSMWVDANTFGSGNDTTLTAYTGTNGNLSQLACNDDASWKESRLILSLTGGTTYYFMVGQHSYVQPTWLLFNLTEIVPPTITLGLDTQGLVNRRGIATVSGTVTCSEPSQVTISGTLTQLQRRTTATGSFETSVTCAVAGGTTGWAATVSPTRGKFATGTATLSASATGVSSNTGLSDSDERSATVTLTR